MVKLATDFLVRSLPAHLGATNWFPGHMAKGLKDMQRRLRKVDVVIEVRDARIPFTSANPALERLVMSNGIVQRQIQQRIILFNKFDLADPLTAKKLAQIIHKKAQPPPPCFSSSRTEVSDHEIPTGLLGRNPLDHRPDAPETQVFYTSMKDRIALRGMLKYLRDRALNDPIRYPTMTLLMVGMPNLGKSTLINALRNIGNRGSKAAPTGAQPGVTRSLAATPIRIFDNPKIYLLDTPGIMDPAISDPDKNLRLALCGGIRDHLVGIQNLAEYLVWKLGHIQKTEALIRTFDIPHGHLHGYLYEQDVPFSAILDLVAQKRGAIGKGGIPIRERAATIMVQAFRDGKLGRFVLDTEEDAPTQASSLKQIDAPNEHSIPEDQESNKNPQTPT